MQMPKIKRKEVRSKEKNGDKTAQSVLFVEFVELVLLVNLTTTVLKKRVMGKPM